MNSSLHNLEPDQTAPHHSHGAVGASLLKLFATEASKITMATSSVLKCQGIVWL